MTSYASQKGRAASAVRPAQKPAQRPLSAADEDLAAAAKAFVLEHMPDMLPLIRYLHADGLIDGWRNVKHFKLLDSVPNE